MRAGSAGAYVHARVSHLTNKDRVINSRQTGATADHHRCCRYCCSRVIISCVRPAKAQRAIGQSSSESRESEIEATRNRGNGFKGIWAAYVPMKFTLSGGSLTSDWIVDRREGSGCYKSFHVTRLMKNLFE